jgi:two-component sensor histidine kinase
LDDEKARAALADSQNRIRSMALIHEKLYQTGDFARIDMGDYFDSMAIHLQSAFREIAGRVSLRVEAPNILLDINRAIPVGLIVNELVTNAMKHAFPGRREGAILIRLACFEEGKYELAVKDDGIGFSASALMEGGATFGLEIVRDLSRQIDGALDVRNNGGTEILLRF